MAQKKSKRVSSIDVAKVAGVSQSTVSRVFSNKAELISPETRKRVTEAAQQLGYRPSILGRALSTTTTNIIGIEINDFSNAYYMKALGMFSTAFQQKGYQLMLFSGKDSKDLESKVKKALDYQVSGLILTNANMSDEDLAWCEKYQTPVFLFNRISSEDHPLNAVLGDNRLGGYTVGRTLLDNGYKRIAYVAGDENAYTNHERESGFYQAAQESEAFVGRIQANFSYDGGYNAGLEFLKTYSDLEAVFCASDSIALGFLDALRTNHQIKIPEDLVVVGYDGIEEGGNLNYKLTTYCQPLEAMVERIVDGMIGQIEGSIEEKIQEKLKGSLLIRDTFKPTVRE